MANFGHMEWVKIESKNKYFYLNDVSDIVGTAVKHGAEWQAIDEFHNAIDGYAYLEDAKRAVEEAYKRHGG